MDGISIPHKVETTIETYEGDWTSEEIEAGLAGEPRVETEIAWYEPTEHGPVKVTDPQRIQELEDNIRR